MRSLLNTLFVTTQNAYLAKDGDTVVVRVENEICLRLPIHTLSGIVCFGPVLCSPFLLGLCAEKGVAVSFLSEHGRFLARIQGPVSGNVLLRREQYRRADSAPQRLSIARYFVGGKIANARSVLLRGAREAENAVSESLTLAARQLASVLVDVQSAETLETLRGLEGDAARRYFGAFTAMIRVDDPAFAMSGRSRRPPLDPVNALLSFLYTLLVHDVCGALEAVGLDPAVGFLHEDRPGRPGLALDLMEEFRAPLADRLALTLINRRQLQPGDFKTLDNGAVVLCDHARKLVLQSWHQRKQEELRHPFLDEKVPVGLIPHTQALLFARFLRGDLPAYPPFAWK